MNTYRDENKYFLLWSHTCDDSELMLTWFRVDLTSTCNGYIWDHQDCLLFRVRSELQPFSSSLGRHIGEDLLR